MKLTNGTPSLELYRQVWEHPDDDNVRLVLADALQLAGDPRGELIMLQLNPGRDPKRRVMKLLQRHGLSWLGALRGHVLPVAYERGFLASCVVVDGEACAGADEWSTVREVELPRDGGVGFLAHPVMRSLRRLAGVTPRMWAQLPALARIEAIELASSPIEQAVASAARFPSLRRISADHGLVAFERTGDAFSRLVAANSPGLERLMRVLAPDALTEVVVRDVPHAHRDAITAFARSQSAARPLRAERDRPVGPNLIAFRSRARSASTSRSRGGDVVTSLSIILRATL